MSLARPRTHSARSGVECTNHGATTPPTRLVCRLYSVNSFPFFLFISAHSEQVVQQVFDELGLTLTDEVSPVAVSNSKLQHQPES